MASRSRLEDLDLTGEEAERLAQAFKDEGFRKLFADYVAELADPAQRAVYEAEVAALERQRGVEARFVHPSPGWVLRTSQAGNRRCYLNVCANPLVGRPEVRPEPGGSCWSLPHCLAPGREELSRGRPRGPHRLVYDVVFHPDALLLAHLSPRFRRLVQDTALEAVEKHFSPGLDRANAVPLRGVKYKGAPQATLLRTPLPGGAPPPEEEGGGGGCGSPLPPFPTPYAYPPRETQCQAEPPARPKPAPAAAAAAATPRWTLRQRSYVDLQDYRHSRDSAPSPVPRELEVTVELPLLSSAAQAQLEVHGQELALDSQRPAAYRLRLRLPYPVDEGGGRATFNKAKRQLVVVLPVRAKPEPGPFSPAGGQASGEPSETTGSEEESVAPSGGDGPSSSSRQELRQEGDAAAALHCPLLGGERGDPQTATPPVLHVVEGGGGGSSASLGLSAGGAAQIGPGSESPVVVRYSSSPPGNADAEKRFPRLPCKGPVSRKEIQAPAAGGVIVSSSPAAAHEESLSPELSMSGGMEDGCDVGEGALLAPAVMAGGEPGKQPGPFSGGPVATLSEPRLHECRRAIPAGPPLSCPMTWGSSGCPLSSPLDQSAGSPPVPGACPKEPPVVPALPPSNTMITNPDLDSDASFPSASNSANPASLLCPPFHCIQDGEGLTVLLEVPGILSQSLKGEVGTSHYRVSFTNKDSASYGLHLQFLPENKLTPPETEVNVSPNNAVITLAKSPDSTGLWTKLDFGPNVETLQERWFVTKSNVAKFLDSLPQPHSSGQPGAEDSPFIEVLDISQGKSQIRLKTPDHNSSNSDQMESGKEDKARENSSILLAEVEDGPVQSKGGSESLTGTETMGRVGSTPDHCLALDPGQLSSAVPEKLQTHEPNESQHPSTACEETGLTALVQLTGMDEEEVHSAPTQSKQGGISNPAPVVIKETNMQDGSVEYISCHSTSCPVTFQNSFLYELD